jgi:ElaB/YqjD/DUF883 family membrane-anchored ribosome-binding protein
MRSLIKRRAKITHRIQPFNIMNTEINSKTTLNQPPKVASEITQQATVAAQNVTGVVEDLVKNTYNTMLSKVEEDVDRTKEYAQQAINATKDTVNHATDVAKDIYHSAALKAGDTLETSKEYVRRNPVPVVLGAVAFGVAMGYILIMARRKPTFGERYADEPLVAVREAILGALAPVTQRVHKGYDTAKNGAEKVMDRVHNTHPRCNADSISDQLGRFGNNLKFW